MFFFRNKTIVKWSRLLIYFTIAKDINEKLKRLDRDTIEDHLDIFDHLIHYVLFPGTTL